MLLKSYFKIKRNKKPAEAGFLKTLCADFSAAQTAKPVLELGDAAAAVQHGA